MKKTIATKDFLTLLEPLTSIIQENHLVPILKCVKLDFTEFKISATGENLEINCINSIQDANEKDFSFCVNFSMLLRTLKSVNAKAVHLIFENELLKIKHSKGVIELPTEKSKEFPKIELSSLKREAKVNGSSLKSSLKVANKFTVNSYLEPTANVCISVGKKIVVMSTNRACVFEEKIKGSGDEGVLLISGKSSTALQSLLDDSEISLKFDETKAYFELENKKIVVTQQQGNFPVKQFKQIISVCLDGKELIVDIDDLITSLKRASTLSSLQKYSSIELDISKSKMNIKWNAIEFSSKIEENIKVKFKGDRKIGYNSKLLIEILSVFDNKANIFINDKNFLCLKQKKKIGAVAPVKLGDDR